MYYTLQQVDSVQSKYNYPRLISSDQIGREDAGSMQRHGQWPPSGSKEERLALRFTFIHESQDESARQKQIRQSTAKSHVASILRKRQNMQLANDPYTLILPNRTTKESRCRAFYMERTSVKCSGWVDRHFWTQIAPSMADDAPVIHQGLVALAAYHEALETHTWELQGYSLTQGAKALRWLNENRGRVSSLVLLAHSFIHTALACLINNHAYHLAIKAQRALIAEGVDDGLGMQTLLKQQLSRDCQLIDPLPLLRRVQLYDTEIPYGNFTTMLQARDALEKTLTKAAFQQKYIGSIEVAHLTRWLHNFHAVRDNATPATWLALKAAYGISMIQIENLYTDKQSVYDKYNHVYEDVIKAFELVLADTKGRPSSRFSIDGGLLRLLGRAGCWCRDPGLREHVIQLMRSPGWKEGLEESLVWANNIQAVRSLEEEGIQPPPTTSADIPEHRRIRIEESAFYWHLGVQRLNYRRAPFTGPVASHYIKHFPVKTESAGSIANALSDSQPNLILGSDYVAYLEEDGSYFSPPATEFYFIIPKV